MSKLVIDVAYENYLIIFDYFENRISQNRLWWMIGFTNIIVIKNIAVFFQRSFLGFVYIKNYIHLKKTTGESILRESIYICREENLLIQLELIGRNYMKYMWP